MTGNRCVLCGSTRATDPGASFHGFPAEAPCSGLHQECVGYTAENMVLQRQHQAVDLQSTSLSPFYQPGNGEKWLQGLLHV